MQTRPIVVASVTCPRNYRFFSALVARNQEEKKNTHRRVHIHEDEPHTDENIDENSVTFTKGLPRKEKG